MKPQLDATHCVIGAGFSGLPVAKRFADLGESFEVLDRNDGVGGLWHTGVYRDAHIISSKRTTQFPDLPMPEDFPDFPSKQQMQRYFEQYVAHFGLAPHIRLSSEVRRVRPASDASKTWIVELADGSERRYQTVTIANGHNWSPRKIRHPGRFRGKILQSNEYDEPSVFEGKRVLVVGYGNTGCDIAVDASRVAGRADISMRSGNYFFPKMMFGVPIADLLYANPLNFAWVDRLLAKVTLGTAVGDLSRYGVPQPKHQPLDKHPIVNTELLSRIRHGRVQVRPDIERFSGRSVHFSDGSSETYDVVVYCTGYKLAFPMLDPADELLDWVDERPVLFLQMLAPKTRGLFLTGIGQARTGGGPLYQTLGYAVARAAAFEARDRLGLRKRLAATLPLDLLDSKFVRGLSGFAITGPADMRSHGIGHLLRMLRVLEGMLDWVGAPQVAQTPRPRAVDLATSVAA